MRTPACFFAVKFDGFDFVGVWAGDVYAQDAQAVMEVEVYPALVFCDGRGVRDEQVFQPFGLVGDVEGVGGESDVFVSFEVTVGHNGLVDLDFLPAVRVCHQSDFADAVRLCLYAGGCIVAEFAHDECLCSVPFQQGCR